MTPDARRRLLSDLPPAEPTHPIDDGLLGEYALEARQRDPATADEAYPHVAAHLGKGCERCQGVLADLAVLVRRTRPKPNRARTAPVPESPADDAALETPPPADDAALEAPPPADELLPEPLAIADAVALARSLEAERDALRAPLRPDRTGQSDPRRQAARKRQLLLVEAALIRQRLSARRLFLHRADVMVKEPPSAQTPAPRGPRAVRQTNPKAHLLLDDFAAHVDTLGRLANRIGRLTADLRRLGDHPHGPARSQSEALTDRGLAMTREAFAVDQRLARLHGPLAGMAT